MSLVNLKNAAASISLAAATFTASAPTQAEAAFNVLGDRLPASGPQFTGESVLSNGVSLAFAVGRTSANPTAETLSLITFAPTLVDIDTGEDADIFFQAFQNSGPSYSLYATPGALPITDPFLEEFPIQLQNIAVVIQGEGLDRRGYYDATALMRLLPPDSDYTFTILATPGSGLSTEFRRGFALRLVTDVPGMTSRDYLTGQDSSVDPLGEGKFVGFNVVTAGGIPEPSSIALTAIGLGILAGASFRRNSLRQDPLQGLDQVGSMSHLKRAE